MDKRGDIIRFGVDGWHARFADGFDEEGVARVADALGLLWSEDSPGATVYVGFDTRHGSEEFAQVAAGILAAHGLGVMLSDRACPTPAVAWSCAHDERAAGVVMLTASERSCEYGGLLVRGSDGGPASRAFLDEVEQVIPPVPTAERGAFETCDLVSAYLDTLLALVDQEAIAAMRPKVVIDAMYGAGAEHLARLLGRAGCEVVEIHAERREDFGGIHPDPRDPWADACEQAVVVHGAQLGLLLDGDGDRAAVVDELGEIVPARELAPLVMSQLVEGHDMSGRVVMTLTCSACVTRQAERLGCDVTVVPVGFPRIYRELLEGDVLMGVEEYGGICVPTHLRERDGLLVGLLAVERLCQRGGKMSGIVRFLIDQIGSMRYARRDIRLEPAVNQAFRNVLPGLNPSSLAGRVPVEVSHADGLRLQFDDDSWVLIRPSRTGLAVRVYAEAPTERERDQLLGAACELVRHGI